MKPLLPLLLLLATPAAADDLLFFRAPSNNIHCLIATGEWAEVRCDMLELTRSFTRRPADCDLEWGNSFAVAPNSRKGYVACVGDSVISPDAMVLNYGQSVSLGGFVCTSQKTGMTCTNPAGHGFSIARARQRLF